MEINRNHFFATLSLLFYSLIIFATGPSSIHSEIRPISINEKGEILCRTKFTKNPMGAQKLMKVEYGFCILTKDTIIQYLTQEINPDGFPDFINLNKNLDYWDSIFMSCYDSKKLSEIGYLIKSQYKFDLCNVNSYKVDKIISVMEFQNEKRIDLKKIKQKALNGGLSMDYLEDKKVQILYDFGNVIILNNVTEFEDLQLGAEFDYYNPWIDEEGNEMNIGYDLTKISGVIFIHNE